MPSSSALSDSSTTSLISCVVRTCPPSKYSILRFALVAFSTKVLLQSLRLELTADMGDTGNISGDVHGESTVVNDDDSKSSKLSGVEGAIVIGIGLQVGLVVLIFVLAIVLGDHPAPISGCLGLLSLHTWGHIWNLGVSVPFEPAHQESSAERKSLGCTKPPSSSGNASSRASDIESWIVWRIMSVNRSSSCRKMVLVKVESAASTSSRTSARVSR
mmetsp:Transcript_126094/g.251786  ORF Transcript_126094/g.251786 Transcript_126094/m.251786 type:complete len:216 (+) Transcript_126094:1080-1727(+)